VFKFHNGEALGKQHHAKMSLRLQMQIIVAITYHWVWKAYLNGKIKEQNVHFKNILITFMFA